MISADDIQVGRVYRGQPDQRYAISGLRLVSSLRQGEDGVRVRFSTVQSSVAPDWSTSDASMDVFDFASWAEEDVTPEMPEWATRDYYIPKILRLALTWNGERPGSPDFARMLVLVGLGGDTEARDRLAATVVNWSNPPTASDIEAWLVAEQLTEAHDAPEPEDSGDSVLPDPPPPVVCASSGEQFEALDWGMDQAYGCAATVKGNVIVGHYGSATIDMQAWKFTGQRPDWVKDGNISDSCIRRLQAEGAIAFAQEEMN